MFNDPRRLAELDIRDFEVLDGVDRVRSIAHEERLAMLAALAEAPLTCAMVARHLGLPVNRCHYHLQRLIEQGLIRETGTGRKRWKEERYYIATARHYIVHPRLGCRDEATAAALERSVEAAFLDWRRRALLGVDLAEVARRVVHVALRVQPGERVLVLFGPPSLELGEAIMVELEASQARAFTKLWSRNVLLRTLDRHTLESLATCSFIDPELDQTLDAVILVSSNVPEGNPPNEGQRTKLPLLLEAVSRWHRSLREREIRYVEISLPHRGELNGGAVSAEQAINIYWRCLAADPEAIGRRAEGLIERMRETVHANRCQIMLEGPGTDLALELDLGQPYISDGVLSDADIVAGRTFEALPAGCISFIPARDTANGVFTADYTFTGGRHYHDIRVVVRDGRIVELDAARGGAELRAHLAAAVGDADVLAEFGIGLVPAGSGPTGKPNLDSCLAGAVTVAFGNNELLGGDVRSTSTLIMPAAALTLRVANSELVRRGRLFDARRDGG